MFELYLLYTKVSIKKKSYKRGLVSLGGLSSFKINFALLTKVVAVYIQFIIIYIWYLSFKGLCALRWKMAKPLVRLQVSFHKLFEQFIKKDQSESWSKNWSEN